MLRVFGKKPVEKINDAFKEKKGITLHKFISENLKLDLLEL